MEDSDLGLGMAESLMDQFHTVKAEVNMSQVCMFGDSEIASHYKVAEFQVQVTFHPLMNFLKFIFIHFFFSFTFLFFVQQLFSS